MNSPRLLIVDDDQDLRELLDVFLTREHFAVQTASDGRDMDKQLATSQFDLIVLDLMMPMEDGLSILRRLRQVMDTPVLILSAKGQDVDKITGLEVGADDYLAKPFNPAELLARIRALLRRSQKQSNDPQIIEFSNYQYSLNTAELCCGNEVIALTSSESIILKVLVENRNVVMSRDDIMNHLHCYLERDPFDRSIDIHITRLRKKIEADSSKPRFIQTVWGKGYKFTVSETI